VLTQRSDFKRNPFRALLRRVIWHSRWLLSPQKPYLIRAHGSFRLLTMRSGSGALIYYQGESEPETANFIKKVLRPGMVFLDVGAHLGEYTVLAAKLVGPSGSVHAFEPNPRIFSILLENIKLNCLQNVCVSPCAVWHEQGVAEFEVTSEPATSALRTTAADRQESSIVKVHTLTLDQYFASSHKVKPDLIKIDVEGAELDVLGGAKTLLDQPREKAPILIFEYGPLNLARFGQTPDELLTFLRNLGYSLFTLGNTAVQRVENHPSLKGSAETCNLMAVKG